MHTINNIDYFTSVLDSLSQQVAVIDDQGKIEWVNTSWCTFFKENGGPSATNWHEINYLSVCRKSADSGDPDAANALDGLDRVLKGEESLFNFEYPCHSPDKQRWFMMSIRPVDWCGPKRFVITHQNITERKQAELLVAEMATMDGLTGIANRHHFNQFLEDEWRRANRLSHSVSLLLIDIDRFKPYNDNYGHLAGDKLLRTIGKILKSYSRRPGDLAARYGGDEFVIVLGDTGQEFTRNLADEICAGINAMNIPHELATGFTPILRTHGKGR
ncbi:MAG: diguanylate cyclase [Sedimenticola sp.]